MELGGFGHAFQMEVLTLDKVKFWRRERPGARPGTSGARPDAALPPGKD
jgi:hypothetical protein